MTTSYKKYARWIYFNVYYAILTVDGIACILILLWFTVLWIKMILIVYFYCTSDISMACLWCAHITCVSLDVEVESKPCHRVCKKEISISYTQKYVFPKLHNLSKNLVTVCTNEGSVPYAHKQCVSSVIVVTKKPWHIVYTNDVSFPHAHKPCVSSDW